MTCYIFYSSFNLFSSSGSNLLRIKAYKSRAINKKNIAIATIINVFSKSLLFEYIPASTTDKPVTKPIRNKANEFFNNVVNKRLFDKGVMSLNIFILYNITSQLAGAAFFPSPC